MARKLIAVKIAIRMIVITKPVPVTLPRRRVEDVEAGAQLNQYCPYCITAKHSIGATVTACSQEKKPNEMPATLPNAKCGNLAVPPETGYIPPSSACTRARMMTAIPAMTQQIMAADPTACAAKYEPNSQPEPMIEVSDAQVAPIKPHLPFQADIGRRGGDRNCRFSSHVRTFFRVRIRGPYARE